MKLLLRKFRENIYFRFFFSSMLILVFPSIVYSFLYMNYFQNILRTNLVKQVQVPLDIVEKELKNYEENFKAIALKNAELKSTYPIYLKKEYNALELCSLINTEIATHPYIDQIIYYSTSIPNRIFCKEGTFSPYYFKQYMGRGEESFSFIEFLEDLEYYGWLRYEEDADTNGIIYVVCLNVGKINRYWVFHMDREFMESLLEVNGSITGMYDYSKSQIYPDHSLDESTFTSDETICVFVQNDSFRLIRSLEQESVLEQVKQARNKFLISSLFVMVAGVGIVIYLSFYNKTPIADLKIYCESKCSNIPNSLNEFDAFRFTVEQIEDRIEALRKKQKEDRVLFQLIHKKDHTEDELRIMLREVGMFLESEAYCALIVKQDCNPGVEMLSSIALSKFFCDQYELYLCENIDNDIFVGVLGINKADIEKGILDDLKRIAQHVSSRFDISIHFFFGGIYESMEDIHWSYLQALKLFKKHRTDLQWSVSFEKSSDKIEKKFIYPDFELDSLHKSLFELDCTTVSLVTNVLMDIIRDYGEDYSIVIPICYNIINLFSEAKDSLKLKSPELDHLFDRKKISILKSTDEFLSHISSICTEFSTVLQKGDVNDQETDFATQVISFIQQNRKNPDISVSLVADMFHMSMSNLSHQFKAITNRNISEYIMEQKFGYAKELLLESKNNIQQISEMIGYTHATSFIYRFKRFYGMTPLEYREQNKVTTTIT